MKNLPAALLIFLSFPLVAQWGQGSFAIRHAHSETGEDLSLHAPRQKQELFDSTSAAKEIERMISVLVAKGHLAASVDSLIFENGLLTVYFFTGNAYRWGDVRFEGLPEKIPGRKRIMRSFRPGNIPQPGEIANRTGEILSWYDNTGHPFARVNLSQVIFRDEYIDAVMQVIPGAAVLIDSIFVRGEVRLNRKLIYHMTGISPGSFYNGIKISRLDRSINSLPYLSFTRDPGVEFRKGGADLYLFMENQRSNQFSGMLGFMSDHRRSGKLVLTGDIQLGLRNSFAWGEEMNFAWKKTDLKNQELNIFLAVPTIPGMFLGFETSLNMFRFDSLYLNLDFRLAGRFTLNQWSRLNGSFVRKSSTVIGEFSPSLPGETLSRLYGLGYEYSQLDQQINPGRGFYFLSSVAFGSRSLTGTESQKKTASKVELKVFTDAYLPVSQKTVIALRGKAGFIGLYGKDQELALLETELFRLGGINSIRGFDENSILASQFGLLTIEYRWLFEKESSFFVFSDLMPYRNNSLLTSSHDIPLGFGLGTRLATRAGMFSISYALGIQQGNPLELKSAKIHMGYISRF